jgi:2-(1,2-epoxy-1,2-dihydrophenyl)acetyl-CoA isomerase
MAVIEKDNPAPGILRLAMNLPEKMNAMNLEMRIALEEAVLSARDDSEVHGLVLRGTGGTYSAGGDIQSILSVPREEFRRTLQAGHRLVKLIYSLDMPTVAAIDGTAVGGGLSLAMCCDGVLAANDARIGFTFLRIGLVPDFGCLYTVPRRVGLARARTLFLDPQLLSGEKAAAIGLVDNSVPTPDLQGEAVEMVRRFIDQPPQTFALTKRLLQTLPGDLDGALEAELIAQQSCFKAPEFNEGVAAFLEKRAADFRKPDL